MSGGCSLRWEKHPIGWWLIRIVLIGWVVFMLWLTHSKPRDYRLNPVTDEEVEAMELLRSR